MLVAVVGGGLSGNAIARAITARGAEAQLFSRSTGFDVLTDDAVARLAAADVIVEATGQFTTNRKKATDFFVRSTKAIAGAARANGARHILLSIVNCELPEVQGYGYFAGKTEQERVAREESPNLTIVRSTQWYDFPQQNLDRMKFGPFALVPRMTMKPVALEAVAEVIAECATGARTGQLVEVAGPEVMTLWDMTEQLPTKSAKPLGLPIPGKMGRAFRDGILVPGDDTEVAGPRYADWLARAGR